MYRVSCNSLDCRSISQEDIDISSTYHSATLAIFRIWFNGSAEISSIFYKEAWVIFFFLKTYVCNLAEKSTQYFGMLDMRTILCLSYSLSQIPICNVLIFHASWASQLSESQGELTNSKTIYTICFLPFKLLYVNYYMQQLFFLQIDICTLC